MRRVLLVGLMLVPAIALAQSQTERGEISWRAGTTYALQGSADSALAAFRRAGAIARTLDDAPLLAAALRGEAEVQSVYMGCSDSAFVLLREAIATSMPGDRAAGRLLIRRLAYAGKIDEAKAIHTSLYADIADKVPRTITRESVEYLTLQAAIQRGARQHVAARETLLRARVIANRLANGDVEDSAEAQPLTEINSQNYWVMYELADLMLSSKTRGVASPSKGKAIMNAVASSTDEPEEGNERRFSTFRLTDRLAVKAWRCTMNGEKCPVPPPRKCR